MKNSLKRSTKGTKGKKNINSTTDENDNTLTSINSPKTLIPLIENKNLSNTNLVSITSYETIDLTMLPKTKLDLTKLPRKTKKRMEDSSN